MQSLDLLDLMFKLEKKFKIKIDSKKLGLEEEGVFIEDVLTESGAEILKDTLPEIKDKIEPGLYSNSILKLLTIQTFVNLIKKELIEEERI